MKVSTIALILFSSSSLVKGDGPCISNDDTFEINGCDYDSFVEGLQDLLDAKTTCNHDAKTELRRIFSTTDDAKSAISKTCSRAWAQVSTSMFRDVDPRFNNGFMNEYTAGGTFLNTETGSFQGTTEGNNIDAFRDDGATNTIMQGFPSLSKCNYNSIMCCFGRDRQPNDNNGNCANPLDQNCLDADPADNSNLCWLDSDSDSAGYNHWYDWPDQKSYFTDPFAFPNDSEGDIHCHGLAWAEDENDFSAQLRFNNFFYVSLYDHMYTRGYVQPTVDSDNLAMCGCIEDMPPVSRSDCTEIEASATFTVSYSDKWMFEATASDDLAVEFNACQGRNPSNNDAANNDLASYVNRLHHEHKVSGLVKDKVFETLVGHNEPGNNNNEAACVAAYESKYGAYPNNVEDKKCSSSTAIFETEENSPISLEECLDLCQNTPGCSYFSLGVDTGNANYSQKGVCLGCAADVEDQDGFNTWELTEVPEQADAGSADPFCDNGILSYSGRHCCDASCGTCGGSRCHMRPGGSEGCCVNVISQSQKYCDSNVAPCIVF